MSTIPPLAGSTTGTDFFGGSGRTPLARRCTRQEQMQRGKEVVPDDFDWLSTHLAEQAVADLSDHRREGPLFLYLSFPAVHMPLDALPADLEQVDADVKGDRREMLGMMAGLDRAVGIVLDGIKRAGLERRTLVVFVNDNGGGKKNKSSNAPLRGLKGTPYEGGHRVPFVMAWPDVIDPGLYEMPVSTLDLVPTLVAAAGGPPPEEDRRGGPAALAHRHPDRSPSRRALLALGEELGDSGPRSEAGLLPWRGARAV